MKAENLIHPMYFPSTSGATSPGSHEAISSALIVTLKQISPF
ncbi:hypothetical protein ABIF65_001157 [Bradyrhizobium japonicum]